MATNFEEENFAEQQKQNLKAHSAVLIRTHLQLNVLFIYLFICFNAVYFLLLWSRISSVLSSGYKYSRVIAPLFVQSLVAPHTKELADEWLSEKKQGKGSH